MDKTPLGDLSELANGSMRCFPEFGSHGVIVCRVAGHLYAIEDNCSHRDAKLSEGRFRGNLITCPLHGAQFDVRDGSHQGPPATLPVTAFSVNEDESGAYLVDS
jgi:3-phenylpropionate/trans-cinnamate dioxygenase ferredoxin component